MGGGAAFMTLSVHITKRLSPQFLLRVGFDAAPGVTIVFGESGSGKTTLLRSVAGLVAPDSGRIAIGERPLFDSAAAVDVPPAGRRVASAGSGVTIAGRTFTIGTIYGPRPGSYGRKSKPRRLLSYAADSPLPGGRVVVAVLPSGRRRVMAGTEWAAWAGESVEDGSGKVG